ncbi:MAG: gliding motility-associated transporter substrate-binding protein GldG [Bacteroidota bacterium]|jgi:gliding-associated putative ABC transporter substrate-binding component GldG
MLQYHLGHFFIIYCSFEAMWAICKKEWAQYFTGLTGYIIIGFYLLVNGLFLFVLPNYNVFDFGYASLQAYFDFAPWFLLLLIPAITMRSFSEEYKQGTYEILRSLPIRPAQLVFAKFVGAFLIAVTSVLPTLIYAIALDTLSATGGLDWGATLGSYWGLLCLALAYTSIGIFASSTTKNSLVALLMSIVLSIVLFKGFDVLSNLSFVKESLGYYIQQLGLSYHYQNMSKGVIAFTDMLYFISLMVLFGIGAIEQIQGKVKNGLILILILVCNYLASSFPVQLDLTKEHRYSLSKNSIQIIEEVAVPVKIHLYLGGDVPAHYQKISQAASQLLNQLKKHNPQNIQWQLEVPNKMFKDSALYVFYDSLSKMGVPIERIQNQDKASDKRVDQLMMPGAIVEIAGQKPIAIDLRASKKYFKPYNIVKDIPVEDLEASANAAEALLEHKFVQAIYLLNRTTIPQISYLIGNGEPVDLTVNDLGQSIKNQYHLTVFDLKKGYPDAKKIKTLLIVKPTQPFTDADKLKLDQFVMSGGNIIWAIDKLYAEYDSLQKTTGSYIAYDRGLQLDDLLFKYGVRLNANLVQDLNCSKLPIVVGKQADGAPMIQRIPWPYYPFLIGNEQLSVTQNLDRILSLFPSSIDTVASKGIQKTILLNTDTNSRTIATPNLVSLNSVKDEADLQNFNKHHLPVAVLLEGNFTSLYANRLSDALKDSIQINTGHSFLSRGIAQAKQIILSDADIVTNKVIKNEQGEMQALPMGMLPFDEYQFANKQFYLNAIALLTEPAGLLESRNKTIVLRLLDKDRLENNKLVWQILLLLGPIVLLLLVATIWRHIRKGQFAA